MRIDSAANISMRILLHGFGSFPVVFWHLIRHAKTVAPNIEWAIILSGDHYEKLLVELLGPDRVAVLNQSSSAPTGCSDSLKYPGALFRDIEAEKRTYKHAPSNKQYSRAMSMYAQARRFIEGFSPTHALVSQVEGLDGKVFIAAAREYGASVAVPTGCRNLGGYYFSPDDFETLPAYASTSGSDLYFEAAESFLQRFQESPLPARSDSTSDGDVLPAFVPPLPLRLSHAIRRWLKAPDAFQWDFLRSSVLNNLPAFRDLIWAIRTKKNLRLCDIATVENLPKRFIYYPLQYSPESSINTPAPYFLDQMRAVDAIRFAMPSDCVLVVKEHPGCILIRPASFVKRLQKTAGVMVAAHRISSNALIMHAGLTISVTGTATLEALLLGRPAITLGNSLASSFLGGVCPISELAARIESLFGKPLPRAKQVGAVATLLSVKHDFVFGSPGMSGEPVLRSNNIRKFFESYMAHCRREMDYAKSE